jgi:hypothetical protein
MDLITLIKCKLHVWKGKFFINGGEGRLILLNSVLSSILLYYLSLVKIHTWWIQIDKIRRDFLWAGVDSTTHKKFYFIK